MTLPKKYILPVILLIILSAVLIYFAFFFNKNDLKVDVNDIEVNTEINRFDKDLFSDYSNIEDHVKKLEQKYPVFFPLFTQSIIRVGHPGYKGFYEYFEAFIQDYDIENAKKEVFREFNNVEDIEQSLSNGFKHYKYYFPDKSIPKIIGFTAGFNHSVITTDSILGIGFDKYLGKNHEFYSMMNIPRYAAKNMRREMIPVDCMRAWAMKDFPNNDTTGYLVFSMIYEGKLLYFLDAMYPEMQDSLKIGYTGKELGFCQHFEKDMWSHIVGEELLFSTDYLKQRKFTGDAPFTAEFGKESPGRVGVWFGWQIVRSYMKNNNVSVPELMNETDFQKILNQSEYQP